MTARTLKAVVAAGLLLAVQPVRADEVDALGGKVIELDARVRDLDAGLRLPPEAGPEIAERRLIDAQVLYELKNYEAASIILFDVVDKYQRSAAYPESLYFLADSLYLKRDFLSSRRYFEKIVERGPQQKRFQESLERLIELSLHTGDYTPVEGYIEKLERFAADQQLPSVPYVKGKYYFFRQQYEKTLASMQGFAPTHPYYLQGLYFVGSAHVGLGQAHYDAAVQSFTTLVSAPATTDAHKRIVELAHLALARLYLARNQLTAALDEYARLTPRSESFNDALYESAWVSIQGKEFKKAARALDLLLLNAPESPLAPEVKLLMGNLNIRQGDYGKATESFGKTHDEFEPIRAELAESVTRNPDPAGYFRDLIAKNLGKFDADAVLPPTASRYLKGEPAIEKVRVVLGDISDLKKSLEEAGEIIGRLEKALKGAARVNVFPELAGARTRAVAVDTQLSEIKKSLSVREAQLMSPVAGDQKAQFDALDQQRAELERQLAALPTSADSITERQQKAKAGFNEVDKRAVETMTELSGVRAQIVATQKFYHDQVMENLPQGQREQAQAELDMAMAEIEKEWSDLEALRRDIDDAAVSVGVDDSDMKYAEQLRQQHDEVTQKQHALSVQFRSRMSPSDRTKAEQIASIVERARGVEQRLAAFNRRIEGMLDVRLKDVESQLAIEKTSIAAHQTTLGGYSTESHDIGGGVVALGVKDVANRFYNIVVRSDVGIIDVAWALKDSKTRETNKLVAERKRELKLLDDEFKQVLKE